MSSDLQQIKVGFTHNHPCSYLADKQERIAIALDEDLQNNDGYELLLANGFRRSGETLYMPHCDDCQACTPIRVPIAQFAPSKSQKRLLKATSHLRHIFKASMDDDWFSLYARYINKKHANGAMYPPDKETFEKFIHQVNFGTRFLHIYDQQKLVAIAVTDILPKSISAFYTFYDPDSSYSLGTLAILLQLDLCKMRQMDWLYLGYHIDECQAMNYKVRFKPHQKLVNRRWQG